MATKPLVDRNIDDVLAVLEAHGQTLEVITQALSTQGHAIQALDAKIDAKFATVVDRLTNLESGQREILKKLDQLTFPAKSSGRRDLPPSSR